MTTTAISMSAAEGDYRTYRLKTEDRRFEPVGNYDVYLSHDDVMAAFHACIAAADGVLGSVYVTASEGDDEWVIAAHTFAGANDSTGVPDTWS